MILRPLCLETITDHHACKLPLKLTFFLLFGMEFFCSMLMKDYKAKFSNIILKLWKYVTVMGLPNKDQALAPRMARSTVLSVQTGCFSLGTNLSAFAQESKSINCCPGIIKSIYFRVWRIIRYSNTIQIVRPNSSIRIRYLDYLNTE